MNPRKAALPFAIAALVAGTVGLSAPVINDAIAQAATAPQQGQQPEHHRFDPTRHIEGRIAFLKAELAITDAQLPQWNAFADTLRARAKSMQETMAKLMKDGMPTSAPARGQVMVQIMTARLDSLKAMVAASDALYAVLSDDQKKVADTLLNGRGPMMGMGMGL